MGQASPFDAASDLELAYRRFRASLADLLRSRGVQITSGTSIVRELGVNRQIAWQLATIVSEPSCSVGLESLPGTRALKVLVDCCRKLKGAEQASETLNDSIQSLEESIVRHAGGRQSIGMLTAAFGPEGLQKRSEPLRRDAYRAQCALLGLQAKVQVQGEILVPADEQEQSGVLLKANYRCFHDLIRLRADRPCRLLYVQAPWSFAGESVVSAEEMPEYVRRSMAFEPAQSTVAAGELNTVFQGTVAWITLASGPVGDSVPVSVAFTGASAQTKGFPPRYGSSQDNICTSAAYCYVPTETMYIDRLMHKSLEEHAELLQATSGMCFDASTHLPLASDTLHPEDSSFLFHLEESSWLTPSDLKLDPAIPSLGEVAERAAARVGTSVDELVGVRYVVSYVMNPTLFVTKRLLPIEPETR
ncbi:MAG: hypothetical protein AAGB34_01085 [Planctomycetota bacterium]